MLNKEETLTHLSNAKKSHVKWVQRANALIEGLPVDKNQVPVDCTECAFGEWFYSDAQKLHAIPNMECLGKIEKHHYELHDIYMKIFKIYFGDDKRSFFSKLFAPRKKVLPEQQEAARHNFKELKVVSDQLLSEIDKLDRRLAALQSDIFVKA